MPWKEKVMKIPRREYTAEFKMREVKRMNSGQGIAATARELGVVEQTLRKRVKGRQGGETQRRRGQVVSCGANGVIAFTDGEHSTTTAGGYPKKSDGVLREGCAMKRAWIYTHRQDYDLTELCETLPAATMATVPGKVVVAQTANG